MKTSFSRHPFTTGKSGQQNGMVLVISLILLVVLTLVAVVAMRSTNVDMQMTTNTLLKSRAFQNAESGRQLTAGVIGDHVFYRGWPSSAGGTVPASSNFTLPDNYTVVDTDEELYVENAELADLISDSRPIHLEYQVDADGDGLYVGANDIKAGISVLKTTTVAAPGSDTVQVSGYAGLGGGAAGGGAYMFFDVRSYGGGPGNARADTGIDYRHVVTN
ncbi:MAG: PilX N-terminal domain-containing pilus assembly protein [Gammaproteobacteria bacterium]